VRKNTLELIFPPVHHNLCFWQILLVSFCFPQISSSCPDMLAQRPVWKSYSWARRRLQSERCQYPHLFPYITSCWISNVSTLWYTVTDFCLTHCSTNSGASRTSPYLVSLRTMLWWRPWPQRLRYPSDWSDSMEEGLLKIISTLVLELWEWPCCTRVITTTSSTHALLLLRVQVDRIPRGKAPLVRVQVNRFCCAEVEFDCCLWMRALLRW
jgi:hypothetical protein